MKYRVPINIIFTGVVIVDAKDEDSAEEIATSNFRAMIGTCSGNGRSEILDWDVGLHCDDVELLDSAEEVED